MSKPSVQITVNGKSMEVENPLNLLALLEQLNANEGRVAVEINGEIIPRSQHAQHQLQADDQIEIVQAIGGG